MSKGLRRKQILRSWCAEGTENNVLYKPLKRVPHKSDSFPSSSSHMVYPIYTLLYHIYRERVQLPTWHLYLKIAIDFSNLIYSKLNSIFLQMYFSISICGNSIHSVPHDRNLGALLISFPLLSPPYLIHYQGLPVLSPKYIVYKSICPLSVSQIPTTGSFTFSPSPSILYNTARLVFEKCKSNQVIPLFKTQIKDIQVGKGELRWPLFTEDMITYIEEIYKDAPRTNK